MASADPFHPRQDPLQPGSGQASNSAGTPALGNALQLHRDGYINHAEAAYRSLLAVDPQHADALHLLGMLLHQTGRSDEGEQSVRQAIAVQPNQAVFHSNLGVILAGTGRFEAAIVAYRAAESLNPHSVEMLNNLGVALHSSGATAQALDCFRRAILLDPDYGDARINWLRLQPLEPDTAAAWHALGDLFFAADRPADAVGWYRKSLLLGPKSAETHNNLGNALFAAGAQAQAMLSYRQAIAIVPDFPQAWNNLANALKDAGDLEQAIAAYQRAIELQPKSPEPLTNLGNAYRELSDWDAALDCYQRALTLSAQHASTLNNIGNLCCESSEWEMAILAYDRAMSARPNYADAINNRGTALEELGKRDQAMACYRQASSLDRNLVSPPWNIALLQLLQGEYEQGWLGYENRWRQKKQSNTWRDFDQPVLIRLPIEKGCRVLLHAEQGFGDAIQFCRFAPLVAQLGGIVILECPQPLVRLFSSLAGIKQVVARGDPLPAFDLHCPLMSLPKIFETTLQTIPSQPYFRPDESDVARWKLRLQAEPPAVRVGLVWAGQSTHQKDRHRSLPLKAFAGLSQIQGVRFYSLQVGDLAAQAKTPPANMQLVDWTQELSDFADTAALISQLDLVITVDTSVAHLTGALGKPVWILIAFQPDWRWLLDRGDSPWYPTARLFRQTQRDDWSEPLAKLADALRNVIK